MIRSSLAVPISLGEVVGSFSQGDARKTLRAQKRFDLKRFYLLRSAPSGHQWIVARREGLPLVGDQIALFEPSKPVKRWVIVP